MIEWFARNPVAANLLMVTIVVAGLLSASRSIPFEVFPSFEIQTVTIKTAFRGATPSSVQDGITRRVEDAIYNIEGVSEINSRSSEGLSTVAAKIDENYDKRELLNEIKLKIDSLNSLPLDAEKPVVSQSSYNPDVIEVAVMGDVDPKTLRLAADKVRDDLLNSKAITLVILNGVPNHEMSIEITPQTLDQYNLTLSMVSQAIRQGAVDVSAGNIKTRDGEILVRTNGQAYTAIEFAQIPVITSPGADPILLGDLATINDGFEEQALATIFDDKPAILMDVLRTGQQSSIEIANIVRDYIEQHNANPDNVITLAYWDDDSKLLKDRLSTLVTSGIQGGILVLLLLSIFLRPAVAFWVFLGVPVSFMGAFIFMPFVGGTFNIISLFAFITVLGIVVDDAIVTGENIYRKMRDGLEPLDAAITGTKEIAIPVTFGVLTTVCAFYPMSDLGANRVGFLAAQIPMVVIPVLIFSLIESKFVLPSHLSHIKPRDENSDLGYLSRLQINISRGFEEAIVRHYQPFLEKCLSNKGITVVTLLAISAIIMAAVSAGHMKFTFFPRVESEKIRLSLTMPDTTAYATTEKHIQHITEQVKKLQEKYRDPETGVSLIKHIYSTVGSSGRTIKPNVGIVRAELLGPEERKIDIRTSQVGREVRDLVGDIPGAEKLSIHSDAGRAGEPINIELSGIELAKTRLVGDRLRVQLLKYPGVFDIQDNYSGGKEELNIKLKPMAHVMGLDLTDIASQVRASIFGVQAQRIQRGRDEVRVMVRLPLQYRSSIDDLINLPIRVGPQNEPIPLSELATITPFTSPTTLYRLNRKAIINITADVDKEKTDVPAIFRDLNQFLDAEIEHNPGLKYNYKGEAQEQSENTQGFKSGILLVLISIYTLLAIPFKSYAQPFIVMSIIPFSVVGAVLGHLITGYDLSILSIVGILALLGVVVNDSLVLVDYINQQRARGASVLNAVIRSGTARFRPVILTSLTTFAGLTPLLLDNSTQAEFLKQMAISLGFGILFATVITLIIIPVNYLLAYQCKQAGKRFFASVFKSISDYWNG